MYQNFWQSWERKKGTTEMVKLVGDCAVISFYYFTAIMIIYSEKQRTKTKQMLQLKLEDTINFCQDAKVNLR